MGCATLMLLRPVIAIPWFVPLPIEGLVEVIIHFVDEISLTSEGGCDQLTAPKRKLRTC